MYNAKNVKEGSILPKDSILDGEIIKIDDGVVGEFISPETSWDGDRKQPAINITVRCKDVEIRQLFTYNVKEGVTIYMSRSNLGKFIKKYNTAPDLKVKVKVQTDKDGFGKIKLD